MAAKKRNGRGGPRVGAGRPPKPAGEKQSHSVTAHLTEAEYKSLVRLAKGESIASLLRRLIVRHLARRRK